MILNLHPDQKPNGCFDEWGNNTEEIQKHLNLHNENNDGLAQKMALIIDKDANWKVENNKNL